MSINPRLKVAVTGASGTLGTAILRELSDNCQVYATSRTHGLTGKNIEWDLFDLLDHSKLIAWLQKNKPDVVIHCAAMVDVDACEKNNVSAMTLHAEIPQLISSVIANWRSRLVYISTDAVFDGQKDGLYVEGDSVNPLNVYGGTKLLGELATLNASPDNLILRTTIFGRQHKGTRIFFADWVLNGLMNKQTLTLFNDVYFTPIHVVHFAKILYQIICIYPALSGLFHLSGSEKLSKYDFAMRVAQAFRLPSVHLASASIDRSELLARRAKNMSLSNEKLSRLLRVTLPSVGQGIELFKMQYIDHKEIA